MKNSYKQAATLTANRFVCFVSGTANTVNYPSTTAEMPAGITMDSPKDADPAIPVAGVGEIYRVTFNDTVTSGKLVSADTSGKAVPYTNTVTAWAYGVLIGPSVAETGTTAEVLFRPGTFSG